MQLVRCQSGGGGGGVTSLHRNSEQTRGVSVPPHTYSAAVQWHHRTVCRADYCAHDTQRTRAATPTLFDNTGNFCRLFTMGDNI